MRYIIFNFRNKIFYYLYLKFQKNVCLPLLPLQHLIIN